MLRLTVAAVAACVVSRAVGDSPIVGNSILSLNGNAWQASASDLGISFGATVPGDLLHDLTKANVIAEPLFELNWKNSSIWDAHTWTYTRTFTATDDMLQAMAKSATGSDVLLVFDGIKMGATVSLNGVVLGNAVDQFLRYEFPLKALGATLTAGANANTVSVAFNTSINVAGRFMACTGGWDWAPYSNTVQPSVPGNARTFTKGIWKGVYLTTVTSAAITAVVPLTYYNGTFPTQPLQDGNHAPFVVKVRGHFWSPAAVKGTVTVTGGWSSSASASTLVQLPQGSSNVTLEVVANAQDIRLWWPVGMGEHPLYNVSLSFQAFVPPNPVYTSTRMIGFRLAAVVTGNDTDPDYVTKNANADGTDSHGMVFRVNGAALYARGANMIPMDELEGRYHDGAHVQLVKSAAAAGMNVLRVWGGGVFLPAAWYDACDAEGVMVYHDMQFAQEGHSPTACPTQAAEFRYQIRRLSHHPSIIIWDGCNECIVIIGTDTGIYATFVLAVVAEEDTSRVLWPSCPALGWASGVNRLSSIPNLSPAGLIPAPTSRPTIETHGPYQHGGGYPAVNGQQVPSLFDPALPPTFKQTNTGLQYQNVFTSETGGVTMSSFESMSPFLEPEHWGVHGGMPRDNCSNTWDNICTGGNPMAERNYPCDNIIIVYFGGNETTLDATGEVAFKKQLYQCMLGQALQMKSSLEEHRSINQFGTMIWQLNEIWPTGGWGSVEYGNPNIPGQVMGGRWKPLHYFLKNSVFTDVTAACGTGGVCYVKNDRAALPFAGTVTVNAVSLSSGELTTLAQLHLNLSSGPGVSQWFNIDATKVDGTQSFVDITVTDNNGVVVAHNVEAFDTPEHMEVPPTTVSVSVASKANSDGSIDITLSATAPAAYVVLTTLAHGRFSDNAFMLPTGSSVVQFIPFGELDIPTLTASLRVEHLATYK